MMQLPDLAHLPPGTPALLLIVGGLVLVVPTAVATLLTFSTRVDERVERAVSRVVLVSQRAPGERPLPLHALTLLDRALERVHRAGLGDPRILQAEPTRKIVRVQGCSCVGATGSCEASRAALERVLGEMLGRRPSVVETSCARGRCEFVVAY